MVFMLKFGALVLVLWLTPSTHTPAYRATRARHLVVSTWTAGGADIAGVVAASVGDTAKEVGATKLTVGLDVYPVPAFVIVIPVTTPLVSTAVAVAPVPPPPEN